MMLGNRKRLYGFVVFGLALGMGVGFVYARAVKVTGLMPIGSENADADGMVIANYNVGVGVTEVQCLLTNFEANRIYAVEVDGSGACAGLLITTNESGNGSGHSRAAADITDGGTGCIEVTVYIDSGPLGLDDGDEVRATGSSSGCQ